MAFIICHELIKDRRNYKEDLIVLTGNLYGEVPSQNIKRWRKASRRSLLWWKTIFGDDLYVEIMRHNQEDEDRVNPYLISLLKSIK